ncbi:hypothetical protein IT417_01045 [bacterium]|nr:hypothetical protein [bacterium]
MNASFVIKIGGSLLYNDDVTPNKAFLLKLKEWHAKYKPLIDKLVVVIGGGKLSREVGENVKSLIPPEHIHDVAMQITQVNAEIVKGYLADESIITPQTLKEALTVLESNQPGIVISGGLKKGWSTDMDAAVFADVLKLKQVYKLSNVEGVFDGDPKQNPNAKLITKITWREYMSLFEINSKSTHQPNKSSPISAETALFCAQKGITYFVAGGKNIYDKADLSMVFESGTVITP